MAYSGSHELVRGWVETQVISQESIAPRPLPSVWLSRTLTVCSLQNSYLFFFFLLKVHIWFYISLSLLPLVPSSSFWSTTWAPRHLLPFYLGAVFSSHLCFLHYRHRVATVICQRRYGLSYKIPSLMKLKFSRHIVVLFLTWTMVSVWGAVDGGYALEKKARWVLD